MAAKGPLDSLSVVIPVFNEERNIEQLVSRCVSACERLQKPYEIILVDDGSADASADLITAGAQAHYGHVKGVILNRNYGQHAAVMAGFAEAKGDVVVTLDADLQNPPEEIPNLVRTAEEGFDVVASIRANRQDSIFRRTASFIVNKAAQRATGVRMRDYGCMLRAYRKHVVEAMLQCSEHSTFIPVLANSFARRTAEIEVGHNARAEGGSKYSVWKLINLQFDLLTNMTTFPLRLLSIVGALIALSGTGFGVFLMVMRVLYGAEWAASGVFTLFAVLFVFIGAQFMGMGLLGEYIGRIYNDVRARPRHFIERIEGAGLGDTPCRIAV